tara:strand:+ start:1132 stop:1974 length:843 start_codon:yes stop_codon:yes gene_type:complete
MTLSTNSLYIVSTPIGNLDDITLRALSVLKNSDIIICEDTRRSLKLLNYFNIKKNLVSYHKFNEQKQISNIIEYINQGKILSLISDAGTPLLSDPGLLLLKKCIDKKINIIPVPGVSSVTTAMSISGFKDQFLFYGFLPKTEKETDKVLSELSHYNFAQIFFVPAVKINFYLKKIKTFFSGRRLIVCRELTKMYETFYRNDVDKFSLFKSPIKGELTLVVSEIDKKKTISIDKKKIINKAKKFLKKYSLKDTVELILETENINKKEVYQLCLNLKNEKSN